MGTVACVRFMALMGTLGLPASSFSIESPRPLALNPLGLAWQAVIRPFVIFRAAGEACPFKAAHLCPVT